MKRKTGCLIIIVLMNIFVLCGLAQAGPVRLLPGLDSITFWERTGGDSPNSYTFGIDSTELTTRLSDPLSETNKDFGGVPFHEFYDVYYSDADGTFNID